MSSRPPPDNSARRTSFQSVQGNHYDVAILGAGITGARIFHELSLRGYRVLLIDRADFASGTSQASGMMIWGGLLYLKDLDLRTVLGFCRARDSLIEQLPGKIRPQGLRYLPASESLRNLHLVRSGLLLYWLLGSLKRRFPKSETDFPERGLLRPGRFRGSLAFEEAVLTTSDCRFALDWILSAIHPEASALNHCAVHPGFDVISRKWHLELTDLLDGRETTATAATVINAAGVWVDPLNRELGIDSPYRHELSKGVYFSIRRPENLHRILVFDTGANGDTFTLVPWGPVALCGPTETRVSHTGEGFSVTPDDIRQLLDLSRRNLKTNHRPEDIVSLRCGVRPLAVKRSFSKTVHPLSLSRNHRIHHDHRRRAIAVYGGKLTSAGRMATEVRSLLPPPTLPPPDLPTLPPPETVTFPGIDAPIPSPEWCRDHEHCLTLEDYLRRRTNIAQWIPRGGLGTDSENLAVLARIAAAFSPDPGHTLAAYIATIRQRHDSVLAAI